MGTHCQTYKKKQKTESCQQNVFKTLPWVDLTLVVLEPRLQLHWLCILPPPPASSSRVDLCRKAGAGFIAASWWPLSRGGVSDTTIPRPLDQNPKTFCSFFNSSNCVNFLSELSVKVCGFCCFVLFLRQHVSAVGSHWSIWLMLFKMPEDPVHISL